MKAVVDKELCTGCELCGQTCPEVFDVQDGVAIVKMAEVTAELEATCREATEDCPVEAIVIE